MTPKLTRKEAKALDKGRASMEAAGAFRIKWKPRPKTDRVIIVDGDIVLHQTIDECIEEVLTGDDEVTYRCDLRRAKEMLELRVKDHATATWAKEVVIALGARSHWRKRVMPEYKANRTGRKPLGYWRLWEWLTGDEVKDKLRWVVKTSVELEADDIVGVAMTDEKFMPGFEKIAISEDKDFKQIPGLLYNPRRPEEGLVAIDIGMADKFHMTQTLTGDSADGYKGCPGIGPVKAEKILAGASSPADAWKKVVAAYEDAGLTEEDALISARVSRILRAEDISKDGKIVLWSPPSTKRSKR